MNTRTQLYFPLAELALATFTLMSPQMANATQFYNNGGPLLEGGNNMGIAFQAEDFFLKDHQKTITGVEFWTLEAPGAYRGSIFWEILTNSPSNLPFDPIETGNYPVFPGVMDRTATGRSTTIGGISLDEYEYSFNIINPHENLAAGRYWLELHNGFPTNLGDPNDFYWSWTLDNATIRGLESYDYSNIWDSNFREHAFEISGDLPLPGSGLLLATGLASLLAWRRRAAGSGSERLYKN